MPPELATDISWFGSSRRRRATRELQPSPEVDSLWVGTTPMMSVSVQFLSCVRRIQELAQLPEGWNSYGSKRIQPAAVEGAVRVLRATDSERLPVPHLAPVADGGIQIEWTVGERSAEVEVRPTGTVEYLVDLGPDRTSEGVSPRPEDVCTVVGLLVHS